MTVESREAANGGNGSPQGCLRLSYSTSAYFFSSPSIGRWLRIGSHDAGTSNTAQPVTWRCFACLGLICAHFYLQLTAMSGLSSEPPSRTREARFFVESQSQHLLPLQGISSRGNSTQQSLHQTSSAARTDAYRSISHEQPIHGAAPPRSTQVDQAENGQCEDVDQNIYMHQYCARCFQFLNSHPMMKKFRKGRTSTLLWERSRLFSTV